MSNVITRVLRCRRGNQKTELERCRERRACLAVAGFADGGRSHKSRNVIRVWEVGKARK